MQYVGEVAALGTALCFAISGLSFGLAGRKAGGLAVNQFRILVATLALFLWQVLATGQCWPQMTDRRLALLLGSGLVGLTIGDLALFHALAVIGPRLASVLMATSPSMALLVALCWRGAVPGGVELMGVAVTSIGVAMVLWRAQDGSAWNPDLQAGARLRAVMAALLGALGQAGGLVMAQVAMTPGPDQPQTVPALSATLVRMVAGAGGILLVGLVSGRLGAWRAIVRQRVLGHSLIGTAVGPILGVWLSLVALQHLSAGAASALMVTTPLFLLPITWFAYRARIGWLGLTGTLLTVAGAVTLVLDKS